MNVILSTVVYSRNAVEENELVTAILTGLCYDKPPRFLVIKCQVFLKNFLLSTDPTFLFLFSAPVHTRVKKNQTGLIRPSFLFFPSPPRVAPINDRDNFNSLCVRDIATKIASIFLDVSGHLILTHSFSQVLTHSFSLPKKKKKERRKSDRN